MSIRRSLIAMHRRFREAKMIVKGLASTDHVVQAQIIPMRRCNLACAYCNEYDDHSKPVPLDEISFKSLKVLDKKLEMLREHAEFHVNINSVVGGGVKHPDDALVIARRAQQLGFTSTVGIIHDGEGQLKPLDPDSLRVFYEVRKLEKSSYARLNHFQEKIAHGEPNI